MDGDRTTTRATGITDRTGLAVVAGATVAALAGLLADGLYLAGRDGTGPEATAQMLRGYDLVTLVVAAPLVLWATTGARRGTLTGRLVGAAGWAYLGYTYAYHVLGNGLTDLLLLHVAVLVGSVLALGRELAALRAGTVPPDARRAARGAAVALGVLAASLGGMWVVACLDYAVTGELPAGSLLVETDRVVQLGIVLDLAVLVPLYGAAAVLLWRGRWWGVVLGAVALVAGILHQVAYLVALVLQDVADVPGADGLDPFEPVVVAVYAAGAALLARTVRRTERTAGIDEAIGARSRARPVPRQFVTYALSALR